MKRLFDIVFAALGLVVLCPVLFIVTVIIKMGSPGPVLFRQQRVGRYGQPFRIMKFRTMVVDAEKLGGQLTPTSDPRITPIGRFLRKYKLDELPQLLNVLIGQMSFVGPRPEVQRYVDLYTEEQKRVLELQPGITDLASIRYRDEGAILAKASDPHQFYIDVVMPDKIRLNMEYAAKANVFTDTVIIMQTVGVLPKPKEAEFSGSEEPEK